MFQKLVKEKTNHIYISIFSPCDLFSFFPFFFHAFFNAFPLYTPIISFHHACIILCAENCDNKFCLTITHTFFYRIFLKIKIPWKWNTISSTYTLAIDSFYWPGHDCSLLLARPWLEFIPLISLLRRRNNKFISYVGHWRKK